MVASQNGGTPKSSKSWMTCLVLKPMLLGIPPTRLTLWLPGQRRSHRMLHDSRPSPRCHVKCCVCYVCYVTYYMHCMTVLHVFASGPKIVLVKGTFLLACVRRS